MSRAFSLILKHAREDVAAAQAAAERATSDAYEAKKLLDSAFAKAGLAERAAGAALRRLGEIEKGFTDRVVEKVDVVEVPT